MSSGKFSDIGWHIEYKSAKKRTYKETCIYLNDYRECQNKKSVNYLSKCFDSTHCPLKLKKTEENKIEQNKIKPQNKIETTDKNRSVLLYHRELKEQIELYRNGKSYNELPALHQVAFKHKLADEFEFREHHYKVLKFYENKVFEESYKVVWKNKNKSKIHTVSRKQYINNGDIVTLYCYSDDEIEEFVFGEDYKVGLQNICKYYNVNDDIIYNREKYRIQFIKHKQK